MSATSTTPTRPALGLALGLALLAGCGGAAPKAAPTSATGATLLTFEPGDSGKALAVAGAYFTGLGWGVKHDAGLGQLVVESPKKRKYGIRAIMGAKGELHRLMIFKAYRPKDDSKGSPKLVELVARLSNDVSGLVYQTTGDGNVVCVTWVAFLDTLDAALLMRTVEWLDEVALPVMAAKAPELVRMLQ